MVLGRNRKSRSREAAGRRNSPEAVPNRKGGMEIRTKSPELSSREDRKRNPGTNRCNWLQGDTEQQHRQRIGSGIAKADKFRGTCRRAR